MTSQERAQRWLEARVLLPDGTDDLDSLAAEFDAVREETLRSRDLYTGAHVQAKLSEGEADAN